MAMIELPVDRGSLRLWIVCGDGNRWLTAVRRFAPPMMPSGLSLSIVACEPAKARAMLAGQRQAVVLWEVRRDSFAAACDQVATVAMTSPRVLQVVAVAGLSDRERIVLSELRATAAIRHPEDLPMLRPMMEGYFARSPHDLD